MWWWSQNQIWTPIKTKNWNRIWRRKNYKTGYETHLKLGCQEDFKRKLEWFNPSNTKT